VSVIESPATGGHSQSRVVLRASAATGAKASEFIAAASFPRSVLGPLRVLAPRCSELRSKTPVCSAYVEPLSRSVPLPRMALRAAMLRLRRARRVATVGRISGRLSGSNGKRCVGPVA
jgi:hypothetical protein